MRNRTHKKFMKIWLFLSALVFIQFNTSHAFFEDQARYAYEQKWLPMLDDPSAKNRFKAYRAFLAFPEWGLPLLHKSINSAESPESVWREAMLIGMIGDQKDAFTLLKRWRKLQHTNPENRNLKSDIWLGAITRLYQKKYVPDSRKPEISSLNIHIKKVSSGSKKEKKYSARVTYQIDNPSPFPRLVRFNLNLWKTRIRENIPERYYWIASGGRIETSLTINIYPIKATSFARMDFKVSDVAHPETNFHKTKHIHLP